MTLRSFWQRIADAAVTRHADWCTIHVRRGDGASHLAAVAHRDRALAVERFRHSVQKRGIASGSVVDDVLVGTTSALGSARA